MPENTTSFLFPPPSPPPRLMLKNYFLFFLFLWNISRFKKRGLRYLLLLRSPRILIDAAPSLACILPSKPAPHTSIITAVYLCRSSPYSPFFSLSFRSDIALKRACFAVYKLAILTMADFPQGINILRAVRQHTPCILSFSFPPFLYRETPFQHVSGPHLFSPLCFFFSFLI